MTRLHKASLLTVLACVSAASVNHAAAQSPADDKARIELLEKEVAALRQEMAAMRGQAQPKAEKAEPAKPIRATQRPASAASSPVQPASVPANAMAAAPALKTGPVAVPYGWTGIYVGGNFGLSAGRNRTESDIFNNVGDLSAAESFTASPAGVAAGVQLGYNWQAARNWVLGLEADLQGSTQREFNCIGACRDGVQTTLTQTLPWFATVRGRLGFTNGPTLFYATGGLAAAEVRTEGVQSFTVIGPDESGRIRETKLGWTAGGGIESQIVGNLTGKVEYLYMDLGSAASGAILRPHAANTPPGLLSTWNFSNSDIRNHVIRVGLNYKFGDPLYVAPAVEGGWYKAVPVAANYNWSGIYAGGNAGISLGHNSTFAADVADLSFAGQSSTSPISTEQIHMSPWGAIGGAQVGFNWQWAPHWVAGLEADFQASGQRDSACMLACAAPPFSSTFTLGQRLPWFGTVRARAGYAQGPALFYLTGGFAYGRVSTDIAVNDTNLGGITGAGSFVNDVVGWTAGTGVEAQIAGNLTGKIEYLYLDFGKVSGTVGTTGPLIGTGTIGFSSLVQDHIVRVGLNYHFHD